MLKTLVPIVLLLSFALPPAWAQPAKFDSLSQLLAQAVAPARRAELLAQMAKSLQDSQPEKALDLAKQSAALAESIGNQAVAIDANTVLFSIYRTRNRLDSAENIIAHTLAAARALGDSTRIALVLTNYGTMLNSKNQYQLALEFLHEALLIFDQTNNVPRAVNALISIGIIHEKEENWEKAYAYTLRAKDALQQRGPVSRTMEGIVANNLCYYATMLHRYPEALEFGQQELAIFNELQHREGRVMAHLNIGNVYRYMARPADASREYETAMAAVGDFATLPQPAVKVHLDWAEFLLERQQPDAALQKLQAAIPLARHLSDKTFLQRAYKLLSQAHLARREPQKAYDFLEKYTLLNDSIQTSLRDAKLAEMETKYDTRLKERQIADLREEQTADRRRLALALVALVGLSGLAAYAWWLNGQRRRANESLLLEKQKTDALLADLRRTQAQLVQTEKMASLGQLTAGIAHEINNPINFIGASAQALKLDIDDLGQLLDEHIRAQQNGTATAPDTAQRLLETAHNLDLPVLRAEIEQLIGSIERGVSRTREVVSGLRNFSRAEQGEMTETDLHDCLDTALLMLSHEIQDAHVTIEKKYAALPAIPALPGKLNQAFLNILTNSLHAVKAAGRTEGRVVICTEQVENQAVVSITDNGAGMSDETLQQIFDPFFTTKPLGEGTGLGLSITYGIVREHGGHIEAQSQLGVGTTFALRLPMA